MRAVVGAVEVEPRFFGRWRGARLGAVEYLGPRVHRVAETWGRTRGLQMILLFLFLIIGLQNDVESHFGASSAWLTNTHSLSFKLSLSLASLSGGGAAGLGLVVLLRLTLL